MKKILILILICFAQNVFSQTVDNSCCSCSCKEVNKEDNNCVYIYGEADIKPEFPGGIEEFKCFVKENYKTPEVVGLKGNIYDFYNRKRWIIK